MNILAFIWSISPVLAIVAKMNILACIWSLTPILAIVANGTRSSECNNAIGQD
jgi:hypothetical protein